MEPTLSAGQGLIGVVSSKASISELRVFEHPNQPDFWMVKRVASLDGDGGMIVRSDNRDVPTVDSLTLGAIPIRGSYRVIWSSKRSVVD